MGEVVSLYPKKIKRPKITKVEDSPPNDYCVYQGDYVYGEDRVRVTVDAIDDLTTLDVYDMNSNTKYLEYTFDNYTLHLLTEATQIMYTKLKEDGIEIF